jgi:RNA polymerase sigma factor (sigma-70 family)
MVQRFRGSGVQASTCFPTGGSLAQSTDGVSATLTLMASEGPTTGVDRGAGAVADGSAIDLALVRRAQAGDDHAFGQLIERNRRAVYRAAYAALGSAADADDVAQETFVAVYQKLHGFRGDASFRTWLLAIAWRKALDRRRSLTRWMRLTIRHDRPEADGPALIEQVAAPQRTQEECLAAEDFERALKLLIAALPRKLRDAILLAGSSEYSYEQIGSMLDIPVGTVKWRVSEARRVLKQKLAALGYAHD